MSIALANLHTFTLFIVSQVGDLPQEWFIGGTKHMARSVVPSNRAEVPETRPAQPGKQTSGRFSLSQRGRSIFYGMLAAALLTVLIALGSRGFHWFDAALIGYAVATIFAVAAVTYKYTFWLARPPTDRY